MGEREHNRLERAAFGHSSRPDSTETRSSGQVRRLLPPSPRRRKRRRHFEEWHESWSHKPLSTLMLGALLIGAPQLLGGILPWTINVIAALSFLCLAVVGLRAPALERTMPRFAVVMLIMTGWTIFQALPLPCGFAELLAPDSVAKQRAIDALMQAEPATTCTLSQDPAGTREELVKLLSLTATFLSAWAFAASGGWRRLFFIIGMSSFAISVVALLHGLLEWDKVFGVYHPVGVSGAWLLSPLMNPNNLGAFAALGAPLWIGLCYRETRVKLRLFGYVATAITSLVAMLSLSRGAIGQLLAGYALMGWVLLRHRARSRRDDGKVQAAAAGRVGLILSGIAGLGVGVFMVGTEAVRQFEGGRLDKLDLSLATLRFAGQHALAGIGRGAFSSAFVGVEGAVTRYRYAENFVAHWLAEWGVPMALFLFAAIGFELVRNGKQKGSLARAGALSALYLFALQNLVDFGFELLGIATVAVALFAGCIAPSFEGSRPKAVPEKAGRRPLAIAFVTLCLGAACLLWIGPRIGRDGASAQASQLRKTLATSDRATFRAQAYDALKLHPAEPVLALLVASEALSHRDPKTLAWLNRAMQLAPQWARPHQLAFRWLWQRGQGRQALLELKQAAAVDLDMVMEDVCRLGNVDAAWALEAAPSNDKRKAYLERASLCITDDKNSQAFDAVVLREHPGSLFPLMHEAQRMLRDERTDEALALLERAQDANPHDHRPTVERFRTLLAAGRLRDLFDDIDNAIRVLDVKYRGSLLELKAYALARAGSADLALQTVEEMRRLAGTDPSALAGSYKLEAQVHLALKQPGQALASYRESYRINEDTSTLVLIANVAESLGDRAQALWAYVKLCEREPRGGGCERRNALLSPPSDNSAR